jgi:hypothetical protein
MAKVFSRARTLFVLLGGLAIGACASSSSPSALLSAEAVPPELAALSQGVTDATLMNAGWSCLDVGGGTTVCAPPGMDLPAIPPLPDNGGPPSYTLAAFDNHRFDHHVKFLRPDLFHQQPCVGGEPMDFFELVGYYHCIIPARGNK